MQWSRSIAALAAGFMGMTLTACGGGSSLQIETPPGIAPVILSQPASQTVNAGQTATFSVLAVGSGTLAYQWKKNGTNVSNATSSSYTTPAASVADNMAMFSVDVTNGAGTVSSSNARLTVSAIVVAPGIATQSSAPTVTDGQTSGISEGATETGAPGYPSKTIGNDSSGTTSSNTNTTPPATSMADSSTVYSVVEIDSGGTVSSGNATLVASSSRYSLVAKASGGTYDKTECVKDSSTGLIWEGKTASGTARAGDSTYTNFDNPDSIQKLTGGHPAKPTQAEIDASTNSMGYLQSVNDSALCGFTDWRLPDKLELFGIVDAGQNPTIDNAWFPSTESWHYWSSSPVVGYSGSVYTVHFGDGAIYMGSGRSSKYHLRLVR